MHQFMKRILIMPFEDADKGTLDYIKQKIEKTLFYNVKIGDEICILMMQQ